MHRILRSRNLWALALPLAISGVAYAGGAHCNHEAKATAEAHDGAHSGKHCDLAKNVKKTARMTDDGAVVTLEGKTEAAVKHIQEHLARHEKGAGTDCPDCPFSIQDVTASVKITDKGGEVTLSATDPETIESVQKWAKKPAADCCGKGKSV